MNIIDIVEFLYQYRMHLALAVILAWVVYAAFHIKKFKPKFLRKPKPKPVAEAPEVKLTQIKSEAEKLRKENERLSLALSLYKKEAMEQEIKRLAQQKLQALIPDELMLLDPLNNPAGRPIYQIGAVPVINKEEELQRLTEQHPLSKILPDKLIKKLLDFIMFRGDTLYFYTAQLLPNGCLKNALVYTTFCGLEKIEQIWSKLDTPIEKVGNGEFRCFPCDVYTLDAEGMTKTEGVFRVKADKKVIIKTTLGDIEATCWHEFYVAEPKKVPRRDGKSYYRRWVDGYRVIRKRADELQPKRGSGSYSGDYLLVKAYGGESWSSGADLKLAYLGGLARGDGTVRCGKTNIKTGKVDNRIRYEIRIYDEDQTFLENLRKIYGGNIGHNGDSYMLSIYNKEMTEKLTFYLNPPINDLEGMRAWIAGFFDAEGCVCLRQDKIDEVIITNTDGALLQKLKDFLLCVGVPATLRSRMDKRSRKIRSRHRVWQLAIIVPELFYEFVKPYCKKKLEKLAMAKRKSKRRFYKKVMHFDGKLFVPIKEVKIVSCDDTEWFYDLANTDRKMYSASGFIVSNSWAIVATSKPPKRKGTRIKPSLFSRPYLLFTSQQPKLDDLIVNKWEVTRAKAAILLSSSFMGPFPAEQLGKIYSQIGWFSGREIAK